MQAAETQPSTVSKCVYIVQVDILVATGGLQTLGHLRDPVNLLSCVGNDAFKEGEGIVTELQLYGSPGSDIVVLQQRAPAMLGRQAHHLDRRLADGVGSCHERVTCVALMQASGVFNQPGRVSSQGWC